MVKKLFSLFAAALMSASMFAQPATVPTVTDLATAGYDANNRVICLYFDEQVCNDIVWAGSYNGWSFSNPAEMLHFEALAGFEGWYVVEVEDASDPVQGRPVQLKKDGSFSWDFQSGDVEAWINMAQPGTKTATIGAGNPGEANCTWPSTGAYIYEVAYFKNHNTPCGPDKPKHDYTITAYLPEFCDAIAAYADSARVMGGFDNWTNGIWMQKKVDEDFNDCWYAEIKDVEEGTEFKLRFGTDADWAVQVQLDGKNLDHMMTGETTDIVLQFDGEGYGFAACPAYKYTEYENWQIKYGETWEWSDDMEKVEDGLFKLEILWEGTGFNVKSDENPIKKNWFAPEELTIGEEVIAPTIVDVYLKVVDDETVMIGLGVIPAPAPVWPEDAPTTAPAAPTVDGASILGAALTTSYAFEPQDWPGAMPQLLTFETGETIYYMSKMTWQIYTNWAEDSYDVSKYNMLHVDLYPATGTEIKITFEGLNVDDGGQGYKNSVVKTLTAGQWNGLDIALSEFPALTSGDPYDFSDIRYFTLEGYNAEQSALTVGNVYFYSGPTALPSLFDDGVKANKFLRNGQLMIRKDGKTYNAMGAEVK